VDINIVEIIVFNDLLTAFPIFQIIWWCILFIII